MHLMLRVESGGTDRATDVVATVEPTHTVDELRRPSSPIPGVGRGSSLARRSTGQVLDPTASLAEVGLVSGEVLTVTESTGRLRTAPPPEAIIRIEAIGGPASGWRAELGPGTYTLGRPWSRAEGDRDYRAIPDAAVSRSHVQVTVADDLSVTIVENPDATNPLLVDGERPDGAVDGRALHRAPARRLGAHLRARSTPAPRCASTSSDRSRSTARRCARPGRRRSCCRPSTRCRPCPSRPGSRSSPPAAPLLGGILMALALQEPRFLMFTLLAPITGAAG